MAYTGTMVLITQFLVCRKLRQIDICYDIQEKKKKEKKTFRQKMMFDFIRNPSKAVWFCLLFKFDIAEYSMWFRLQN